MENQTEVSEFIFLGLTHVRSLQSYLFTLFLLLYMASILGNGATVAVILAELQLHTPMYFFLGNLSSLDIFFSTVTVPKMLAGFLSGHHTISFTSCLAQLHFFHFLGSSEAMLLAVMAYDRYVAICNPLRYTLVMNPQACLLLAGVTWATGFLHALMHTVMTSRLHFCGPNRIHHFFCDIKPLLSLACSSTRLNLSLLNTVTGIIGVSPFILTLLSYLYIISFLSLKVRSRESRRKAFSTCTSHLTVIALYYGTVIFAYLCPSSGSSKGEEMIITLVYSVITPDLNPLIYTLRNSEVKYATRKFIIRKLFPETN
ncbi:olfactory receptor 12D2-like [Gopherus evgoodei]|uniref:Olfactory receptor n=1 Tax=Gopherus evgoodei TaxID=1825980 RepID=A0A8C4YNN4_9SAUR|nr:olfactory receptor 12D2-like [Gopherus evgoodei]XP_030398834.1 olfactory receptor 12D2-like [Gopherus evgoodei]XP_030398903.1 olfactory receptor 12D2-like [Gopherus evgoodei]